MDGRKPRLGESNLGAMAGLVVAAVGGLFAPGLALAIHQGGVEHLIKTPILGLICWLIGAPIGWLLGGQLGFRMGQRFESQRVELLVGGLAGLVPAIATFIWAWKQI